MHARTVVCARSNGITVNVCLLLDAFVSNTIQYLGRLFYEMASVIGPFVSFIIIFSYRCFLFQFLVRHLIL